MSDIQESLPCPICGKSSYSWGNIFPQSLQFCSDDADSFQKKIGNLMLKKVPARQCNSCGNIQIFSEGFADGQ